MIKRKNSFDFLRVLSAFAVVMIHANFLFSDFVKNQGTYSDNVIFNVVNTLTRFSVPVFVMLSGALALSNPKNKDYKYFYKKSFIKIAIPFLIFLVLYILYNEASAISNSASLVEPLINAFKGELGNLWFMYMIIGLYLLVPVLIRFIESVSNKAVLVTAITLFAVSFVSCLFVDVKFAWDFTVIGRFLSYFLFGYYAYDYFENHKQKQNNKAGYGLFILSLIVLALCGYGRYLISANGINIGGFEGNPYMVFLSPGIIICSCLMFVATCMITINKSAKYLSDKTFIIYLAHSLMIKPASIIAEKINVTGEYLISMIIVVLVTFILALIVAIIYDFIFKKVFAKNKNKI